MMARNRHVEKGFTLIELLVVIAIVGILAGLLIPAVLFGKFKGRVTTCTNNYRQLALAAAMYAGDDSKGRLPSFELPTESSQQPPALSILSGRAMSQQLTDAAVNVKC